MLLFGMLLAVGCSAFQAPPPAGVGRCEHGTAAYLSASPQIKSTRESWTAAFFPHQIGIRPSGRGQVPATRAKAVHSQCKTALAMVSDSGKGGSELEAKAELESLSVPEVSVPEVPAFPLESSLSR